MVSTTGQGDLPANATIFWKSLLRKKLPTHCLSQVDFALFGLGDSSYEKFNWAARKFRKRILQLGANEAVPFGEGDERHDNGLVISAVDCRHRRRRHITIIINNTVTDNFVRCHHTPV